MTSLSGTSEEIVQHGTTTYVRMPSMESLDPALAGKWVTVDAAKLAALDGAPAASNPSRGGTAWATPRPCSTT